MDSFVSIFTTQWGNIVRWWNGILDNLANVLVGLAVCLLLCFLSKKLAHWVSRGLSRLFRKWPTVEQGIYTSLRDPLRGFLIMLGIFALFKISGTSGGFDNFLNRSFRIVTIALVTWSLMNFTPTITKLTIRLNEKNNTGNEVAIRFIANIMKLVIVSLAVCIIVSELGFNINGIITGLGLGGLTLSLAAKNTASNLFSGFEIISDRPFDVGDYIKTPSIEGTVEDMTMRSTRVRTVDDLLVVMPNARLMEEPITNYSAMGKRFVKTKIGLEYTTSNRILRKCLKDIRTMLEKDDRVDNGRISVNFIGFGDSSLDIQIIYFTVTTNYDEYLKVTGDINFRIREIVVKNGSEFAYPSQSLYFAGSPDNLPKRPEEAEPSEAISTKSSAESDIV